MGGASSVATAFPLSPPAEHRNAMPVEMVLLKEPKMLAYRMGEDIENYLLWSEQITRTWKWPEEE